MNQGLAECLGAVISSSVQTDRMKELFHAVGALSLGVPYPQAQERYEVFAQGYREAVFLTGVTLD